MIKYMMVVLRGKNLQAKYNLELLRFLIHQLCTLSEREANETLYSLFVNTQGKIDSHVPADLVMEHHVKTVKDTIRALGSNKINHDVIKKRTAAESAFEQISENYCDVTNSLVRAKKLKKIPNEKDEIYFMLSDIQSAHPFGLLRPGKKFQKFATIKISLLASCDYTHLIQWIVKNQKKFDHEIGQ